MRYSDRLGNLGAPQFPIHGDATFAQDRSRLLGARAAVQLRRHMEGLTCLVADTTLGWVCEISEPESEDRKFPRTLARI